MFQQNSVEALRANGLLRNLTSIVQMPQLGVDALKSDQKIFNWNSFVTKLIRVVQFAQSLSRIGFKIPKSVIEIEEDGFVFVGHLEI